MSKPTRHYAATPRELTRWLDAAHAKVESGKPLTVDDLRALVSTPERAGRTLDSRRTWWLEEAERMMKEQARDKMPSDAADLASWQARQDDRADQLESLLDAHADALQCAAHVVASITPKPVRPRKSAATLALDATIEDAA